MFWSGLEILLEAVFNCEKILMSRSCSVVINCQVLTLDSLFLLNHNTYKYRDIKICTPFHKLPVENGRWENIARENRICPLCNNGEIGDEFHYLFKCQYFGNQRKNYGFLFRSEFFFRYTNVFL
jgi:hypothetical protein